MRLGGECGQRGNLTVAWRVPCTFHVLCCACFHGKGPVKHTFCRDGDMEMCCPVLPCTVIMTLE
jgi:hypothetical protein